MLDTTTIVGIVLVLFFVIMHQWSYNTAKIAKEVELNFRALFASVFAWLYAALASLTAIYIVLHNLSLYGVTP